FEVPAAYREALQRYADEGGRILWIGGTSSPILGHLAKQLRLGRSTYMPPVSEVYGTTHEDVYENVSFVFQNSLGNVLGSRPCKFVNPPHTEAGWQRPRSNYYVDTTDERIVPLATAYMDDEAVMCVAAYAVDNDGQPTHCFLPEYLVAPYVLSKEGPMTTPAQPRLDDVSRQIFMGALNVLRVPGS
ncbi:MAG: hypothetical protein L3K26_06190, partial [Candidatus Hydrogenedentes bacterium]|nr:hypothetical protein [Candidatus Hydrogenedentota bacterium]